MPLVLLLAQWMQLRMLPEELQVCSVLLQVLLVLAEGAVLRTQESRLSAAGRQH